MSSISATINGRASLVERGAEEEKYYREAHLDNHNFVESGVGQESNSLWGNERPDGGRETYIERDEVRVVLVKVTDGRVSDWKGQVRNWSLLYPEAEV